MKVLLDSALLFLIQGEHKKTMLFYRMFQGEKYHEDYTEISTSQTMNFIVDHEVRAAVSEYICPLVHMVQNSIPFGCGTYIYSVRIKHRSTVAVCSQSKARTATRVK